MKSYNSFLFDFDGTLSDSRINITNSFNYAFEKAGLPSIPPELIHPYIGKLNLEETILRFFPDIDTSIIQTLLADFRFYQKEHVVDEIVLFETVRETIENLHQSGKQLAILTTKHVDQITYILGVLGLDSYFTIIFGLGLKPYTKPHKECVKYILEKLQCPKEDAVMIGDSIVDCETARNGGIDMIGVSHGTDSKEVLLKNGAVSVLESFAELLKFKV